jgi:hypothetical protein
VRLYPGYCYDIDLFLALNLFYSQLEAMALREEFVPEEYNDKTAPQIDLMLQVDQLALNKDCSHVHFPIENRPVDRGMETSALRGPECQYIRYEAGC